MKYLIIIAVIILINSCGKNRSDKIIINERDIQKVLLDNDVDIYSVVDITRMGQSLFFGNINMSNVIKIRNGKIICVYGRSGNGPEEFSSKINSLYTYNEKIYVLELNGVVHELDSNLVFQKKINLIDKNRQSISPNLFSLNSMIVENNKIICGALVNLLSDSKICDVGYVFDFNGNLIKKFSVDKIVITSLSDIDYASITKFKDLFVVSFRLKNILLCYTEECELQKVSEEIIFPGYEHPTKETQNFVRYISVSANSFHEFDNYLLHFPNKKNSDGFLITEVYNSDLQKIASISLIKPPEEMFFQIKSFTDQIDIFYWDLLNGLPGLYKIKLKKYLEPYR